MKWWFIKIGEWNGVIVIDDYGYYLMEILVVLRVVCVIMIGKIIVVV